ncbi:hypothetical protein POM88_039800 [Heracleum sosnowskyi]|uniref:Protein FAR1-RELATED SEQUENCE n=1 Tax=Heracleum sosnowskyi TaxID=360622 RepID=A0AAD8HBV5_9APIA|nr:hypothetical protein POM88_039800 [Heracleum sosnowskyi]
MLCTRHIAKNVEARTRSVTKSVVFALGFLGNWNMIVHAETEVSYEENVQHFQKIYAGHQELLKYVQTTWLIHARKFVHAYTNKVLHFGNRTTNRVESAHNSLKRFLKTSTGNLDTVWSMVHSLLELQENEIKASFVGSANKDLHIMILHLLTPLTGKVSHMAIKKIMKKYSRHGVNTDPKTCGCYLRTSHGLPCANEMRLLDEEGRGIDLNDVHIFWRTLHMEGATYNSDDRHTQFQDDDEILWHYFNIMMKQSPEAKKMYISQLEKLIHLEALKLEEPFSDRKSKGRPNRSSTKRDPSYFEHVEKKVPKHKSGDKRKSSTNEECFPPEIPHFVVPYIHEYVDVSADGNCGYRSVAHQIYGSEDQWRRVRTDLYDFLEGRLDYWMKVWHKNKNETLSTLHKVNYCESPCSYEYWMSMEEMGPVIAIMYNVILVAIDPIQMVQPFCFSRYGG